ncbi:hypothetical protein L7F22_024305 [Adiantum nelumboides]|nr:hypothetical protein [Adiantum nelumboides]
MFSFGVNVAQAATKVVIPSSDSVIDEEAQKRNTDCIYFLASPLTCKKGSTCEYRHSEAARMNPRDCWFWKAGNCLNPHCSFRHLPLDGKSVSAASVASTSSAPVVMQLAPATPLNKSKTPCYFFSQGYCAKNDKCPFVHGGPAASRADLATRKKSEVGVKGSYNGERPLIVLKQSASKVPITSQKAPLFSSYLEESNFSERSGIFTPLIHNEEGRKPSIYGGRLHDAEQSQLKVQNENVQAADWRHLNQVDALLEDAPLPGSSLDQHAWHSDSCQILTSSTSNTSTSNGRDSSGLIRSVHSEDTPLDNWESQSGRLRDQCQVFSKHVAELRVHPERADKWKKERTVLEEQDSSTDLRSHLMDQRTKNKVHAVLKKPEVRGQADRVIRNCGSQWLSKDHSIQKTGKLLVSADIDGTEVGGRGNLVSLERATSRKVSDTDRCLSLDSRQSGSSRRMLSFAGPKTLAQIKAEKMAGRHSTSDTVGNQSLSSGIIEAGEKVAATRKLAKSAAEVVHLAASSGNLSSSLMNTGLTSESHDDKQTTVTSLEFEGSKPLRVLLKRKRELESDSKVGETMSESLKVESTMLDSTWELEDGEVGDDSEGDNEERLPHIPCLLGFSKEGVQAISPSSREVVPRGGVEGAEFDMNLSEEVKSVACLLDFSKEGVQAISPSPREVVPRGGVEGAEFDMDLSEEVKSVAEMEDVAYGDANCSLDDDDDEDDEEDFAKKLGRFFALSSN